MYDRLRLVAAVGMCLVVLLGSCDGAPTADEWADRVCAALMPWRTEISALNAQAQDEIAHASTPSATRSSLLDLLGGAEAASENALAGLALAGVPDVAGGGDVARRFTASLEGTRDAYTRARHELEALPTDDDATFYTGVVAVLARLNSAYANSAIDTKQLESPELRAAFDGSQKCR